MRLAILSDIHSNLTALDTLMPDIARADRVVCLGDVTGYYGQPNEAVDRMQPTTSFGTGEDERERVLTQPIGLSRTS